MEVSIQTANSEHLNGIHGLVLEWGYPTSTSETLDWMKALMNSSNHQVFVAVCDNSIVGWTAVEKRILLGEGVISEITGLVVRSSCRRMGIGQLLINAVEIWSQNLGLSRILVRSNLFRVESHEFYPSAGFELMKTTKVYTKELTGAHTSGGYRGHSCDP